MVRRIDEHKQHLPGTFTGRYFIDRLVYYEGFECITDAIGREKQLKRWKRSR